MNMYSSVLSDMNIDFQNERVWAKNISEISKSIIIFSNEITAIGKNILNESTENQKWLIEIIQEFNSNLHLWIDRHANELAVLESSISWLKSSNTWGRYVLELTEKRLENQIKHLQKI